jgi:polyphosphate:AMP phosphotransferase
MAPNEEEALRPFLWRFWVHTPSRGRMAIFDQSWYRRVLTDRVDRKVRGEGLQEAFEDIRCFERQLADGGTVIVKLFLHISRKEQKRRLEKLRANPATSWRVTSKDLKRHKQYEKYLAVTESMLAETDADYARWTIVEAHDRRFASLKVFNAVIAAIENALAGLRGGRRPARPEAAVPEEQRVSLLDGADLSVRLSEAQYGRRLKNRQDRLRDLEHEIHARRIPVVIVCEGWDAAGKGGNIRRLTQNLDPRGYEVVPIGPPNDVEKAHHYLWRFWHDVPKAGHMTIFDRSWYGRVLVERVEGFCPPRQWRRAYREINEMERHMTNFGVVLLKFWLQIDKAEQLRRFKERERVAYKRWKITADDWRNREKWDQYKAAAEEMLFRTGTPYAPWTVVESNCKWYARVKVLDTVIGAIERSLG